MSFDAWVQWFDDGDAAAVAAADIRAIFGDSIVSEEGTLWQLSHEGQRCCEVTIQMRAPDQVAGVAIHRPCPSLKLWDAVHALVMLDHGMCYWPGGPPVIALEETVGHLPADMSEALGEPQVASNGLAISQLVEQT